MSSAARTSGSDDDGVRRITVPRWLPVTAGPATFVLTAWASLDGRENLRTEHVKGWDYSLAQPSGFASTEVTPSTTVPLPPPRAVDGMPGWLGFAVLTVLGVLLAVALGYLLRRLYLRAVPATRPAHELPDGPVLDLEHLMTREDASRQTSLLHEGSPRNAVVATWLELERLVAAQGVTRRPSETSSEMVVRALGQPAMPSEALSDLNRLYREARFSRHDLTEEHRQQAAADLDAVHTALGVRGEPQAGAPGDGPEAAS